MKIIHLSTNKNQGGAAIATNRLSKSLREYKNCKSFILSRVFFKDSFIYFCSRKIKAFLSICIKSIASSNSELSPTDFALMPSSLHKDINRMSPSVVNLHWINSDFISIEALKKISFPIVWTLHDLWPLNGSLHYLLDSNTKIKYGIRSKILFSFFYRINKKRLMGLFKEKQITFICPSKWILKQWEESTFSPFTDAEYIPNALDVDIFKPLDKILVRKKNCLSLNKKLVFFGAEKANKNTRKGFHLLLKVFEKLYKFKLDIELVTVGTTEIDPELKRRFKINSFGEINSEEKLVEIYSSCDLIVVPSVIDNLPQVATEAVSCGLPIIAFDVGGLSDIVVKGKNGYLIDPFDLELMSMNIKNLIQDDKKLKLFSLNSRKIAEKEWSSRIIAEKYFSLYEKVRLKFN